MARPITPAPASNGAISTPSAASVDAEPGTFNRVESRYRYPFRVLAFGEHQIVEGSAALALAALYKVSDQCAEQNNVVLLCASNIAESTVLRLLNPG